MITNLERLTCIMVRAGHSKVFDYPWGLFLVAAHGLTESWGNGK